MLTRRSRAGLNVYGHHGQVSGYCLSDDLETGRHRRPDGRAASCGQHVCSDPDAQLLLTRISPITANSKMSDPRAPDSAVPISNKITLTTNQLSTPRRRMA